MKLPNMFPPHVERFHPVRTCHHLCDVKTLVQIAAMASTFKDQDGKIKIKTVILLNKV